MSLEPAIGETITIGLVTSAADGGAVDADALPTCAVYQDGNDVAIFSPAVVKRASSTGLYRVTIPCTAGNGFVTGKTHEVVGRATVGGKAALAILDRFILRGYSVDGVNVLDVAGQPATVASPGAAMSLTPAERLEVAKAVKIGTGNDTTAGSLGQQSKDMYDTMAKYGGLMITGKVDASPTPTTSAFNVTLDLPLAASKAAAGISGQFCTIRAGGAQTEGNPIASCVKNSATSLSLTFGGTAVFSVAPAANDPVSISE